MGIFVDFTSYLNTLSTELVWFIFLFFCFCSILIFLKIFGYIGLYIYSGIAVIAANIQVLKIVDFFYSPEPVALGTVLFASTFLSSLIDNTVFSLLAWIILNPNPEKLYNVIMIYIFGTYLLRVFIAILDTPFLYFSKFFIPNKKNG